MITQLIFHFSSNLNIELRGTGENTACLNIFFGRIVDYMVNIFKSNRDTIEVYLGANQTFMMKLFDRLLNKLLHKNDVNRHITRESSGRRETPTLFNLCLPFLIIFIPLQLPFNNWLFCKAFINRLDIYFHLLNCCKVLSFEIKISFRRSTISKTTDSIQGVFRTLSNIYDETF